MSVDVRFKKVKQIRACFRCARSGHRMTWMKWMKWTPCGRGSHIPQLCKTGGVKIPEVQNPTPSTGNPPNHPSWNPAASPYTPANQSHLPLLSQLLKAAVMSSAKNTDIKTAGVMMRTVCVVFGDVAVSALCNTGVTFTMMSSFLAANIPKRVVGKRHLRIETLGDVLEGEFDVVQVTARGVSNANTFTFHAVVTDELSGVFERVEPESY